MKTYARKAAQAITPLVVIACAVAGTAAAEAGSSTSQQRANLLPKCQTEVQFGSGHYRYVRFRRGALKSGAKLKARARLQCEPALVCLNDGSCSYKPGVLVRPIAARQLRGVKTRLAIIDSKSGRVYINRQIFPISSGGKRLLKLLKSGGGPQPNPSKSPHHSKLLATNNKAISLAIGDYCWSTSTGDQTWVQSCTATAAPSSRFDLPLVVADEGASLHISLAFGNLTAVRVTLWRNGSVVYSEPMGASESTIWTIPDMSPVSYYLQIEGDRTLPGAPNDFVNYWARLQIVAPSGSG